MGGFDPVCVGGVQPGREAAGGSDFGYSFTRIKTNGRKLEKVVLESLFGTVLLAKRTEDGRYVFETQAKNSTAKSPMGAFETFEIDNDMAKVLKALDEF